MTRPILVFDLDGTLVDTAPDLLDSLNHIVTAEGLAPIDPIALRGHVGHGGRVMLQRAFASQGQTVEPADLDRMVEAFVAHYAAGMPGRSAPFEGALACLDRCTEAGFTLAVCTNKYEGLSRTLLDGLGISDRFAAICGADTFDVKKPDPGHLTGTIAMANGLADQAVMVGDSKTDIDTAKAAKIPVIAVDFGYATEPVETLGPDRIISHYDELTLEMVQDLMTLRAS